MSVLAPLVAALADGSVEVVDLTSPLSPDTVILELPAPFANTKGLSTSPVSNFDDAGPAWAWNDLSLGEHAGTHLDAPTHWITGKDGNSVDRIPPARLVGPIVVIDKTAEAAADPDFALTPADFDAWIAEHGELPEGCWVLFRTGWSGRSGSEETFLNTDENGPHTPGITPDGARWLAENPRVSGYGVETVGIDSGQAGAFDLPFPAPSDRRPRTPRHSPICSPVPSTPSSSRDTEPARLGLESPRWPSAAGPCWPPAPS